MEVERVDTRWQCSECHSPMFAVPMSLLRLDGFTCPCLLVSPRVIQIVQLQPDLTKRGQRSAPHAIQPHAGPHTERGTTR